MKTNILLAEKYDNRNPSGYLISEKLDGIRAIWNGEKLISRNGNAFAAPEWFLAGLPDEHLDGEIYMMRGQLQKTCSIVKKSKPVDAEWEKLKFHVFDAPNLELPYIHREMELPRLLLNARHAVRVNQTNCQGFDHLNDLYKQTIQAGGEGLMIRDAFAMPIGGRDYALMKYKPVLTDEAELVECINGKGRLSNAIGKMVVAWKGITFNLGSGIPDSIRFEPLQPGATISFAYLGLTDSGQPRSASFLSIRDYE